MGNEFGKDFDPDGNTRYFGSIAGKRCRVVVALDDPDVIMPLYSEGARMKVDYDSEAHSLLFEFGEFRFFEEGDYVEQLAGSTCLVSVHEGQPGSIQLLSADKDIERLDEAADRFDLHAVALRAGGRAALAAPDHEILIDVRQRRPLGSEEDEAETAIAA